MEYSNKIKYLIVFATILLINCNSFAMDITPPKDLPTIEALIELHKQMKKNEQASLTQVATVTIIQDSVTHKTSLLSDVKTTLNKKMSDVNSYLVFATTITNITLKLKDLVNEYSNFITVTGGMVIEKPYTSLYYYNAHKRINDNIERLRVSIAAFSAAGINILKASMDEKFKVLYQIDGTINAMRGIINSTTNYIRYAVKEDFIKYNLKFYDNDARAKIADKLIQEWNKNKIL